MPDIDARDVVFPEWWLEPEAMHTHAAPAPVWDDGPISITVVLTGRVEHGATPATGGLFSDSDSVMAPPDSL